MSLLADAFNPSLSVRGPVAWLLLAGAVAGALVAIRKVVWPLTKALVKISEQWPLIAKLADSAERLAVLAAASPAVLAVVKDVHELKDDMQIVLAGHRRIRDGDPPVGLHKPPQHQEGDPP